MQNTLDLLSPDQRQVYDLLAQGKSVDAVASQLGKPPGIVLAQITRMKTKGIDVPITAGQGAPEGRGQGRDPIPETVKPLPTGASSNEAVLEQARKAGTAEYDLEKLIAQAKTQGAFATARDIHPMILLGTTLQYMKLCGGRFAAHQLIEDVYCSLRTLVGEGQMTQDQLDQATKAWPPSAEVAKKADSKLDALLATLQNVQKELTDLKG